MLTRLRFKRDFKLIMRCLSEKPSDGDGKLPDTEQKPSPTAETKAADSPKKIQQPLKSMVTAQPKISGSEYEKRFTVAKDRRHREHKKSSFFEWQPHTKNVFFLCLFLSIMVWRLYLMNHDS